MTFRLAAVFAHPDDETYGLAGTLALNEGTVEYTLVVGTSGEAGVISDPTLATRETLGHVREAEQREALAVAGAPEATVHFLRHPDGGLKEVDHEELVGSVTDLLVQAHPHVVVTFGPEGITKHDDHVAIGQVATEAFHAARSASNQMDGFQRLFYYAMPASQLDALWTALRARGVDVGDVEGPFMPRGVPDHTITVRTDCRAVLRRKVDALRAHRTQQVELDYFPEDLRPRLLGEECFVQAWPPVTDPEGPVASSIFEGVTDDGAG